MSLPEDPRDKSLKRRSDLAGNALLFGYVLLVPGILSLGSRLDWFTSRSVWTFALGATLVFMMGMVVAMIGWLRYGAQSAVYKKNLLEWLADLDDATLNQIPAEVASYEDLPRCVEFERERRKRKTAV